MSRKKVLLLIGLVCFALLLRYWFAKYPETTSRTYNSINDRDKKEITSVIDDNEDLLREVAAGLSAQEISEEAALKTLEPLGIKSIRKVEQNSVVLEYDADGFASASWQNGIFYAKDDEVESFPLRDSYYTPFEEYGEGYYSDDGTDNYIYLERIKDSLFYYCVGY